MILSDAHITAFFEEMLQMVIPRATILQLQQKGIDNVDDLIDFDKDTLNQVDNYFRHTGGQVPYPNPGVIEGATILTPQFFWRKVTDAVTCSM